MIMKFKKKPEGSVSRLFIMERVMGIEPTLSAWKAEVLPLNYTRAKLEWSGRHDSNMRPPGPKPGALPS
jgi:hypothetical protein